jgi:hypothetical protein
VFPVGIDIVGAFSPWQLSFLRRIRYVLSAFDLHGEI